MSGAQKFSHAETTVTVTQHPFVKLSQVRQAQGSIQIQQPQIVTYLTQCLHLGCNIHLRHFCICPILHSKYCVLKHTKVCDARTTALTKSWSCSHLSILPIVIVKHPADCWIDRSMKHGNTQHLTITHSSFFIYKATTDADANKQHRTQFRNNNQHWCYFMKTRVTSPTCLPPFIAAQQQQKKPPRDHHATLRRMWSLGLTQHHAAAAEKRS